MRSNPVAEPQKANWWILSALAFGTYMGTLDGSITNIALPAIASDLKLPSVASASWVTLAYLLTSGSLFLLFGRLGEYVGTKRIYNMGLIVFTIGSVLCGLAPSFLPLVIFRVIQGVGSAMIVAVGPAILTTAFPANQRGRALGLNSAIVSAGLASGPTIGGFLLQYLDWRSIFWINLPIGLVGLIWAMRILPVGERKPARVFDVLGAALLALGLLCILLATTEGATWGWRSAETIGSYVVGTLFFAAFIVRQLKLPDPLLDLRLFRERSFSAGNSGTLFSFAALAIVTFLTPFFLVETQGRGSQVAGLALTAMPIGIAAAAPLAGILSDRFGARILGVAGMLLMTGGTIYLSTLDIAAGLTSVVIGLFVCGAGNGMFQAPNTSLVMGSVRRDKLGTASGMIASMRTLGFVFGIAIAGAVVAATRPGYDAQFSATASGELVQKLAFVASIHDAIHVATFCTLAALILSLARGQAPPVQSTQLARATATTTA